MERRQFGKRLEKTADDDVWPMNERCQVRGDQEERKKRKKSEEVTVRYDKTSDEEGGWARRAGGGGGRWLAAAGGAMGGGGMLERWPGGERPVTCSCAVCLRRAMVSW